LLGFDTAGWLAGRHVNDEMKAMIDLKIIARKEAREAKDWAGADRIRDELLGIGVVLKDNKDGTTTWELLH
jgi:cysteinyl-tRNA synthetase